MATIQERRFLMSPDDDKDQGARRRLVDELHRLVKSRLALWFSDAGVAVPRDVANEKELTVGTIETRLSDLRGILKDKGMSDSALEADESEFAIFRAGELKRKAVSSGRSSSSGDVSNKRPGGLGGAPL